MELAEDLRAWLQDRGGCRYPNIAWRHLDMAQKGLSSVRPSCDADKNRENAEMMQVVEDAAVSIIASATAVDTHILVAGFFAHDPILRWHGAKKAKPFSRKFLLPKGVKALAKHASGNGSGPFTDPLKVKSGRCLFEFARRLCSAVVTEPEWPQVADLVKLKKRRDELIHNTATVLGLQPTTTIRLLEDYGGRTRGSVKETYDFVAEAAGYFRLMVECCKGCILSAARKAWDKDTPEPQRKEAIARIVKEFQL